MATVKVKPDSPSGLYDGKGKLLVKFKSIEPRCRDCGLRGWGFASFVLRDELWKTVARKKTVLCLACTEGRLGRRVTLYDLKEGLPLTGSVAVTDAIVKASNPKERRAFMRRYAHMTGPRARREKAA